MATGPYRDKSGSGGYTYRQWSDGTIKILAGPNSVGREIAPNLEDPVWRAITLEIGAPKAFQLALQQYVSANPPKVVGSRATAAPATRTPTLSTWTQIAQALTQGGQAAPAPAEAYVPVGPAVTTPSSSISRGVLYAGGALLGLGAFAALFTVLTRRRR